MEQITDGLTKSSLVDDNIVVYTLTALNLDIMEKWADAIVEHLETHPVSKPYLVIHNLSTAGLALPFLVLSGYDIHNVGIIDRISHQIQQYLDDNPDFRIYLAVILSPRLTGRIAKARGNIQSNCYFHANFTSRVFMDYEDAVKWLSEIADSSL